MTENRKGTFTAVDSDIELLRLMSEDANLTAARNLVREILSTRHPEDCSAEVRALGNLIYTAQRCLLAGTVVGAAYALGLDYVTTKSEAPQKDGTP